MAKWTETVAVAIEVLLNPDVGQQPQDHAIATIMEAARHLEHALAMLERAGETIGQLEGER